jgi:hypothetical protein
MNIPFTIAFSTNSSVPFYFIENVSKTTMVRNVIVHNTHSGTQEVHLTYKAGYADTIGIGTVLDFYSNTLASKGSFIFNDMIICNPGDSVGVYGAGNNINVVANCVVL